MFPPFSWIQVSVCLPCVYLPNKMKHTQTTTRQAYKYMHSREKLGGKGKREEGREGGRERERVREKQQRQCILKCQHSQGWARLRWELRTRFGSPMWMVGTQVPEPVSPLPASRCFRRSLDLKWSSYDSNQALLYNVWTSQVADYPTVPDACHISSNLTRSTIFWVSWFASQSIYA